MTTRKVSKMVSLLCAGLFSVALAATSKAPEQSTSAVAPVDPGIGLLETLSHGQLTVEKTIPVSKDLTAYLVSSPQGSGQKMIVFVADGQYVIAGNVVTAQGESLTQSLTQKYITRVMAKTAYAEADSTAWFVEGKSTAPHKLYIVIDPNCIFCHMLYQEIQPMIESGAVQVRWIPVGFLKPDSMPKAVAIWMAKDPVSALAQDEATFNTQTEEGSIAPVANDSKNPVIQEAYSKIASNTAFFGRNGFQGTPALLYKEADGTPNFYPGYLKADQLKTLVDSVSGSF